MASTFWTAVGASDAFDTNAGMPGGAPLGSGAMQGNPDTRPNITPSVNVECPVPQNSAAASLVVQLATGAIPHNLQTTNVAQGAGPNQQGGNAGGDSLLAQMSRGQVMLGDSTYGQGGYTPAAGGQPSPATAAIAQVTGASSGVTYPANNPNLSGM